MSDDFEPDGGGGDDMPTQPFWMGTFSDMVTLLLTFFVLLVAMSSVEVKKFQEALSYFNGGAGMMSYSSPVMPVTPPPKDTPKERAERFEEVLGFLQTQNLTDKVEVSLTDRGVLVVITDSVMFGSGSAELLVPSQHLLSRLNSILSEQVQSVLVEGHTDNIPIRSAAYPSNWELSAARAAAVVRFLLSQPEAMPPDQYGAAGYGEFRPLDDNATAAGRGKNRRVEILFSWESWQTTLPKTRMAAE